jgi:sigma-B regulation protein RsbU (phosphoserine phosphatase)
MREEVAGLNSTATSDVQTAELLEQIRALRCRVQQLEAEQAENITEQKRSEQWIRTILELAPDAMVVTDGAGRIVLVNAQTERVFGYRREELLGQSVEILVPERFRQRHAGDRGGYMARPEVRGMGSRPDLPARRKDGSELVAEIALSPIRMDEGVLVFSVIRDVTERRRVEKALRENEAQLTVARKIQEYFLPRAAPALAGFDIAGASYPAEFTAGDHFDYIPMSGSTIGIVIGDVSGHGFGPALLMVSLRNHLRALVDHHDELDEILSDANRLLSGEIGDEHFITVFMGRLDPKARTFRYLNAGHPAGYLLDASGQVKASLESTTLPLGVVPDLTFPPAKTVRLQPGDLLFLLTDGILEAQNGDRELFGADRTLDLVRANRHRPAREIIEVLHQEVLEYSDQKRLADDVTLVLVKAQA